MRRLGDVGARPDMVEPAAAVGGLPVAGAVAPPAVELALGNVPARDVAPAARLDHLVQPLHLLRRVADDVEKLPVRPDVVLERGDVEIADENAARRRLGAAPVAHVAQVVELLAELRIGPAVGHVASGGDVEVVDDEAALEPRGDVAGMAEPGEVEGRRLLDGKPREDGDAVVPLLAARHDVRVADLGEDVRRDAFDRTLALLQADEIGALLLGEPDDERRPQANRVDVPSRDGEGHGACSVMRAAAARSRRQDTILYPVSSVTRMAQFAGFASIFWRMRWMWLWIVWEEAFSL